MNTTIKTAGVSEHISVREIDSEGSIFCESEGQFMELYQQFRVGCARYSASLKETGSRTNADKLDKDMPVRRDLFMVGMVAILKAIRRKEVREYNWFQAVNTQLEKLTSRISELEQKQDLQQALREFGYSEDTYVSLSDVARLSAYSIKHTQNLMRDAIAKGDIRVERRMLTNGRLGHPRYHWGDAVLFWAPRRKAKSKAQAKASRFMNGD